MSVRTRGGGARWRHLSVLAALLSVSACAWVESRSPGERLWRRLCADCHGLDGAGNTVRYMGNPWADLLDDGWRHGGGDPNSVEEVIRQGIFGEMPAHDELSGEQMSALLDYFYSLRGETR